MRHAQGSYRYSLFLLLFKFLHDHDFAILSFLDFPIKYVSYGELHSLRYLFRNGSADGG